MKYGQTDGAGRQLNRSRSSCAANASYGSTQFLGDEGRAVIVLVFLPGNRRRERATGVTEWVLTRPVTRSEYLTARSWCGASGSL